ncbi:MAG: chromosomal protein MC1 [Candidatus Aenigmarchaeota archaeon]|nr:chromosomal protein MC1 [Candidatus Aenigmarchaeota archaeon]
MARRASRKYYILRQGRNVSIFTGRQPRQAALKAATRGVSDIKLRERGRRNRDGTYSIHVFRGSRKKVTISPEVSWLPSSVWKPVVKKVRVDRIRSIR